jgi:hypothetical protein
LPPHASSVPDFEMLAPMHRPDPPLAPLITRAWARAAGMTDRQITRRVAAGDWRRVRHGLLVPERDRPPVPIDAEVAAAVRSTGRDVAISVAHAARIWGLPRPLDGWGKPVLLAPSGPTRNQDDLCIRVAPIAAADVLRLPGGVVVTSPRRTVVDCLRHLCPPDAIAIADAALRGLLTPGDLVAGVEAAAGWPGVRRARRLAALADGRRETPLESWSALAFADLGVPMPRWQVDVLDDAGLIGRADAWWATRAVVGEADGRAKYALAAAERGGADADGLAAVLDRERRREQRLRRVGAAVVRWGAADVLVARRADALASFLRRELRRHDPTDFAGTTGLPPVVLAKSTVLASLRAAKRYTPRA